MSYCPVCRVSPVGAGRKTCGSRECKFKQANWTRQANRDQHDLWLRETMYGKGNPWVEWQRRAMEEYWNESSS